MALDIGYSGYDGLSYDQAELASVMRATYDDLIDFVSTPEFGEVMKEMSALHHTQRPRFVFDVLLRDEVLARRGVHRPKDVLIQRSAFGDRRPTIFVVKKFLPEKYKDVWQNMNITFDNEFIDASIGRDPETSWRAPLSPDEQAAAIAAGQDLEEV